MSIRKSLCALLAISIPLLAGACSSTKTHEPTAITGSKYYLLDPEGKIVTPDPMLRFERSHHLHGAITREEKKQREGHYYVFWWTDEAHTPATVRLETRHANTGSQVKVQEIQIDDVRRKNKTRFQVTGDEFFTDGKVISWRVSIIRDGQALASDQSYLW